MAREKQQFSVRLPPDAAEKVEEYADDHDISKADALRRAVDDYFVRAAPDGGEVMTRLDEIEERQDRSDSLGALQMAANLIGLAYIGAVVTGVVGGVAAIVLGLVILVPLVGLLAYSVGQNGWQFGGFAPS